MSQVQFAETVSDGTRNEVYGLWERGELSESDVQHDRRIRQTFRDRAKQDLYFFTKAVLGYDLLIPRIHKPYARFIQDHSKQHTLDLMPRGVFKTTIGTIGYAAWEFINDPNITILITNQIFGNASRMLTEIEHHFEGGNTMVNWLFPEFVKTSNAVKPWSDSKMSVPDLPRGGPRTSMSGTATVTALGLGAKAESQHYHIIINDDLIGRVHMQSPLEMAEAISWHEYSLSLAVNPKTVIERVHGTRWGINDLYGELLKMPWYHSYVLPARDPDTGEPLIPELLDDETLRNIRDTNYLVYMSQYMNDPVNEEALDFNRETLRYYRMVKTDRGPACEVGGTTYYVDDMNCGLFVDPASSGDIDMRVAEQLRKGRSVKANNAVGIWGVHKTGRWFLLDLWTGRGRGKNPELEVCNVMLEMAIKWRGFVPRGYMENYGAENALITLFDRLAKERGYPFRLEPVGRSDNRKKPVRIRSYIGPAAMNGDVHVRASHTKFIEEFSQFPQSTNFDTLDMSAWAFAKLRRPATHAEEQIEEEHRETIMRRRRMKLRRTGY